MVPDVGVEALVIRYRPLAIRLAQRYVRTPDQREDLEQAACLGLVKAANRFDRSRGTAFSAFAMPTILGELRRHCRDTRWALHVPRPIQERVQAARHFEDAFTARHGRAPTALEAADALGCSEEDVLDARMAATCLAPTSLNVPIESADGAIAEAMDGIGSPDRGYEDAERHDLLEQALQALPGHARLALRLRTERDLTTPEIARHLGMSTPQAGRMIRRALTSLRELIEGSPAPATPAAPSRSVGHLVDDDPHLLARLHANELARARRHALARRARCVAGPPS